jgi:phosphoesterase RecJ-like protein
MTGLVRQLASEILSEINKSQNILLHCHPSPDPDSYGSALALYYYLISQNKKVTIIAGDSEIPKRAACLPGIDKIISQNYFQINPEKFDLFLILDASSLSQISKLGEITFPPNLRTVVIDHHLTNSKFADVNLVDTSYPAVGQMLFDLFSLWKIKITREIAICLFLAIYTDTGGFKYEKTNPETFVVGGELAKIVPDFWKYVFEYENQNDPENIYYEALALNSVKLFFGNKVAISIVPNSELQKWKIRQVHTEKTEIANQLKSVVEWEIGASFVEREEGITSVSFRTRNPSKYDVSKIAVATKFGGGHPAAAGATLKMPFNQALKYLLDTISSVYPDLGSP